jgi:hypothetical protein
MQWTVGPKPFPPDRTIGTRRFACARRYTSAPTRKHLSSAPFICGERDMKPGTNRSTGSNTVRYARIVDTGQRMQNEAPHESQSRTGRFILRQRDKPTVFA